MEHIEVLVNVGNFRRKVNFHGEKVAALRLAISATPEFAEHCNPSTDRLQVITTNYSWA